MTASASSGPTPLQAQPPRGSSIQPDQIDCITQADDIDRQLHLQLAIVHVQYRRWIADRSHAHRVTPQKAGRLNAVKVDERPRTPQLDRSSGRHSLVGTEDCYTLSERDQENRPLPQSGFQPMPAKRTKRHSTAHDCRVRFALMAGTNPYETWMASCPAVDVLTPMEFCFPGTHDTGAYQKPDFAPVVSSEKMATSEERFLPAFQEIATRWTVSQPACSIYTQLVNGVRFLDLRVAYTVYKGKPSYFLVHTFAVCSLDAAMADIKRFVESHPTELVVMDITNRYHCNDTDLMRNVQGQLGKWMFPRTEKTGIITTKIGAILKQNKRLIGIYRTTGEPYSDLWFVQSDIKYSFPFESKDTVAKKQAYILEQIKKFEKMTFAHPVMFQLEYTLTEVAIDVAESIFTGESLALLANKMNPTMMAFVRTSLTEKERRLVNIITVDNESKSNVIDVAIMLNEERIAHRKALSSSYERRSHSRIAAWLRRWCCCCCGAGEKSEDDPTLPLIK